jgi:hypothetical protein
MKRDPIVDDVRAIRDAIAREHNYDLDAIFRMLRDAEARSGRGHVSPPPPAVQPLPKAAQLHVAADETLASLRSRS